MPMIWYIVQIDFELVYTFMEQGSQGNMQVADFIHVKGMWMKSNVGMVVTLL